MDKFLEKYNLPKLNQEEIENLNRSIINMEMETVIKKSSNNQKPRTICLHMWILPKIYRKANLTPILLNLFLKIAKEDKLPNCFHEGTITLITIPDKYVKKKKKRKEKENDRPISLMEHRYNNLQQNSSKQNPTTNLKHQKSWPSGLFPRMQNSSILANQIPC